MKLTPAERSAINAVAQHGTIKEAALSLGKSRSTVNNQLASARARLDVGTTIQMVRLVR